MKKKNAPAKKSKKPAAAPAARGKTKSTKKPSPVAKVARKVVATAKRIAGGNAKDILNLIVEHHKPLKDLIKTLKSADVTLAQRKAAFEKFAPLLASHAKAEEEVLYVFMKKEDELREEGFEGDVEHGLADQLLEEIPRTTDGDLWAARVKVVAELVEHHIKEEENGMFPDIRENSEEEDRVSMGETYNQRYEELLAKDGVDTASEKPKQAKIIPAATHS